MQYQVVILSGGRDPHLLQVRNEVLRVPGFTVVSAYSPEELIQTFRAGDFDIVLMCHSFSNEEQSKVALAVHAQSPSTPVLAMSTGERASVYADAVVSNDPSSLLSAITVATSHSHHTFNDWRERA